MKRKDFLKTLGAGVTGLTGLGSLSPLLSASNSNLRRESKNFAWIFNHEGSDDELKRRLEKLKNAGLSGILPSGHYEKWLNLAGEFELDVHAWMITLQRGDDNFLIENHPDWFMVNRNGESSVDKPAYVDYYKWLCPTRPEAQQYILDKVDNILQYSEISSVHLDYIRFPDIILPIQLQPTYDIVQDREYPQYDYCYCNACRNKFKDLYGVDPMELPDPPENDIWNRFRYNRITHLVNKIAFEVHERGNQLTAAVFPTPNIARRLVRQNWPDWNLDAVFPMIYHNFYHNPVSWIGEAVAECRSEMPATTALYAGVYVPNLTDIEVSQAFEFAMKNGAAGITLFPDHEMSSDHWDYLSRVIFKG